MKDLLKQLLGLSKSIIGTFFERRENVVKVKELGMYKMYFSSTVVIHFNFLINFSKIFIIMPLISTH